MKGSFATGFWGKSDQDVNAPRNFEWVEKPVSYVTNTLKQNDRNIHKNDRSRHFFG
jgi:hypothetical protein